MRPHLFIWPYQILAKIIMNDVILIYYTELTSSCTVVNECLSGETFAPWNTTVGYTEHLACNFSVYMKPCKHLLNCYTNMAANSKMHMVFSALTLLVGRQEWHLACKNRVVGWWCGYLSGTKCRFADGPADATTTHCLLLQEIQTGLPFWYQLTRVVPDKIQRAVKRL